MILGLLFRQFSKYIDFQPRYLDTLEDSAELKAKILDWKPEVFETKTRRQSNQVKVKTGIKEIFGIDLKTAKESKRKMKKKKEAASAASQAVSPPTPSPAKSDISSIPSTSSPSKSSPTKSDRELEEELTGKKLKKTPKKAAAKTATSATPTTASSAPTAAATTGKKSSTKAKKRLELEDESAKTPKKATEIAPSGGAIAAQKQSQQSQKQSQESQKQFQDSQKQSQEIPEEDYIPTEREEEMQNYLQDFALELLESNPSWSERAVIQNLVIWEPVGPVIPMKKVRKFVYFMFIYF